MDVSRKRILIIFGLVFVGFVFFLFKTIKLELFPDPRVVQKYKAQSSVQDTPTARRGNILDRNGKPLAVSVDRDSIFADPFLIPVEERPALAKQLSDTLDLDYKVVLGKLSTSRRFVRIKNLLSFEESEKIKSVIYKKTKKGKLEKRYPGIGIIKEPKRMYPNESLASHVVGFVNHNADGVDGVEKYYDEFIKMKNASVRYSRDASGNLIYSDSQDLLSSNNGNTVYLTIDSNIQYQIERELKKTVEGRQALSGTVVVMSPNNGEILALANYPSYDPNDLSSTNNFAVKNRAITDIFEPGSTFKIVTAGIALKNKVIDLDDKLWGEHGKFQVAGGRKPIIIKEAKGHDYGYMDVKKLIVKSSNVGSAKLGIMIGKKNFYRGIDEFGFGHKTEVDLPGEVSGLINRDGRKVELANIGFGQGISVTALQLVKAYAIIANGGYAVTPHVLKKITNEDGETIYDYVNDLGSRIISKELSLELSSMLRAVVEEGTGTGADISGFEIAGKTGTAQKPIKGGYSLDKYATSFAGFFPASNPQYVMLTLIDEPKGAYFSAAVAVPLFRNFANIVIQGSEGLIPTYNDTQDKVEHKEKEQEVEKLVQKDDFDEQQNISPGAVPNLLGKSARTAIKMIPSSFKKVNINGSGRVVKQEPQAGPKSEGQDTISIWLE